MASNVSRFVPLNVSGHFEVPTMQSPRITSSPRGQLSVDPLLASLSPGAVLEAIRTADATIPASTPNGQLLVDSISEASSHERALGVRAALAGKRIRDWINELRAWSWSARVFQPPADSQDDKYWGSLTREVVLERENRLERIKDALALLETEDLKNHVRNIYLRSPSRTNSQDSLDSTMSRSYNRLADFNVVIATIIMQSLPDLATLVRLLNVWSVRVAVSRQIPDFLRHLRDAKLALESAWTTVEQTTRPGAGLVLTRETYEQIKQILEDRITRVAKSIDTILDGLEGHEDRIPDDWIDDVEEAESDYKNWVVEAEKLVELYEWQASNLEETVAETAGPEHSHGDEARFIAETISIPVTSAAIASSTADCFQDLPSESEPATSDPILDSSGGTFQREVILEAVHKQSFQSTTTRFLAPNTPPMSDHDLMVNIQPLIYTLPTKFNSSIDIVQEITPPRSHFEDDMINGDLEDQIMKTTSLSPNSTAHKVDTWSPDPPNSDNHVSSAMDSVSALGIEEDEKMHPLSSTNQTATNQSKYQHPSSSMDANSRSRASSLQSRSITTKNEVQNGSQQLTRPIFTEDISAQQEIESLQQDFDDALESIDGSPSLMVRKVRLPLESLDMAAKSPDTTQQATQVEDKMTAKISRLLTDIPAPIHLSIHPSRAEAEVGSEGKAINRVQRQTFSASGLTLSPAAKARTSKSNDLGVRVYHLHQSGREVPIKLFIRLVGDEERVMVRVGGGWADLAEYLKEYAIHHGRRSVSNNSSELDGLPHMQTAIGGTSIPNHSPSSSITGIPTRRPVTPRLSQVADPRTPESTGQSEYTPSSSEPRLFHARSRSSTQEDDTSALGLGGPKGKKIDLSPQKRAWVNGMLGQARQISSEHRKTDDIGDLGKVGNTKRVYLRGTSDSFTSK